MLMSFTVLFFILKFSDNLTAEYADLVALLTGRLLISVFFIDLMSLSDLGPEEGNNKR